jgi:hypothetical protein
MFAAEVYPIETVYATIEVKGTLKRGAKGGKKKETDLDNALLRLTNTLI